MDQCKHCLVRGNLSTCKETACFYHELWMVKESERASEEVIRELVEALEKIVVENKGWIGDHSAKVTCIAEKALAQARKHLGE